MANDKPTADQAAAEKIGRAIEGQIFRLTEERATLAGAAERMADIDAELLVLQAEKSKIDGRRPPRSSRNPGASGKVAS